MCTSMQHNILSQHIYARPFTSIARDDADDEADNMAYDVVTSADKKV